MPPIQVIQRESPTKLTDATAYAMKQQELAQDIAYKKSMLKMYADKTAADLKMSQDEVEKVKLAQQVEHAKLGMKVFDDASKAGDPQQYLITAQRLYPDLFPALFEGGFGEAIKNLRPSPQNRVMDAAATMLEGQSGGVNDSRAGAIGGARLTQIAPPGSGLTFEVPEAKAASVAAETRARNIENMMASVAPALAIVKELRAAWHRAFDTSNPKTGSAILQGIGSTVGGSWARTNKDVRTYLTTRRASLRNMLRGLGERGVITDKDIADGDAAISTQWDSIEQADNNFSQVENIIKKGVREYIALGPAFGDKRLGWDKVGSEASATAGIFDDLLTQE